MRHAPFTITTQQSSKSLRGDFFFCRFHRKHIIRLIYCNCMERWYKNSGWSPVHLKPYPIVLHTIPLHSLIIALDCYTLTICLCCISIHITLLYMSNEHTRRTYQFPLRSNQGDTGYEVIEKNGKYLKSLKNNCGSLNHWNKPAKFSTNWMTFQYLQFSELSQLKCK